MAKTPLFLLAGAVLALGGCSSGSDAASGLPANAQPAAAPSSTSASTANAETTPPTSTAMNNSSPTSNSDTGTTNANVSAPPKKGDKVGVIKTNFGEIVIKFFPDKAPKTVANFEKLAGMKFYDGTKFHRMIPGFMIQGGDPNTKSGDRSTWGQGGPPWHVPAEFSDIKHVRGIVSMARSQDPDSAGSQFFIMVGAAPQLDGQYSAFGYVLKGMDVADKIVRLPTTGSPNDTVLPGQNAVIESVRIEKWPVK